MSFSNLLLKVVKIDYWELDHPPHLDVSPAFSAFGIEVEGRFPVPRSPEPWLSHWTVSILREKAVSFCFPKALPTRHWIMDADRNPWWHNTSLRLALSVSHLTATTLSCLQYGLFKNTHTKKPLHICFRDAATFQVLNTRNDINRGKHILPLPVSKDAFSTLTSSWQQMRLVVIWYFLRIQIHTVKEKLPQLTN